MSRPSAATRGGPAPLANAMIQEAWRVARAASQLSDGAKIVLHAALEVLAARGHDKSVLLYELKPLTGKSYEAVRYASRELREQGVWSTVPRRRTKPLEHLGEPDPGGVAITVHWRILMGLTPLRTLGPHELRSKLPKRHNAPTVTAPWLGALPLGEVGYFGVPAGAPRKCTESETPRVAARGVSADRNQLAVPLSQKGNRHGHRTPTAPRAPLSGGSPMRAQRTAAKR